MPADLRLFEAKDFKVSEMALTGAILGCQTVKMVKQQRNMWKNDVQASDAVVNFRRTRRRGQNPQSEEERGRSREAASFAGRILDEWCFLLSL